MKEKIIEMIALELTKPRQLSDQIINHILSHYSYTLDQIDKFFNEEFPRIVEDDPLGENYEIDLLFASAFTPKVSDKAIFSKILDEIDLTAQDVEDMISELERRNLQANFYITIKRRDETIVKNFSVRLGNVNLRRYVRLLNLEYKPSKELSQMIEVVFRNESDFVKAILRDKFWKEEWREEFLRAYLLYSAGGSEISVEKFNLLLKIFLGNPTASSIYEIYELLQDVISWSQSQVDNLKMGRKQFFNELIEQGYRTEGGDKRNVDEGELNQRETELRYYLELKYEIGYIIENMREILPINNARRLAKI